MVDSVGYYVDPTTIQVMGPKHEIMQEVCLHVKQLLLTLPEYCIMRFGMHVCDVCVCVCLHVCVSVCVSVCQSVCV